MDSKQLNKAAFNLAVFRMGLVLYILCTFTPSSSLLYARMANVVTSLSLNEGFFTLELFQVILPFVMIAIFSSSLICSFVGFKTNISLLIAGFASIYVLGLPQLFGKINHYHHLVWLLFVLSATPCSQRLSVDALQSKKIRNYNYKKAFTFIWITLSIVYFFPGLWKLLFNGLNFDWANNVIDILHYKWFEDSSFSPIVRIDTYPNVLFLSALGILLFELFFPVTIFVTKLRPLFAVIGLIFHIATEVLMFISFRSLLVVYILLFDWHSIFSKLESIQDKEVEQSEKYESQTAYRLVALLVFLPNILFGFLQFDSWPYGIYPTFAYSPPVQSSNLEIIVTNNAGSQVIDESYGRSVFNGSAGWLIQKRRVVSNPSYCEETWNKIAAVYPNANTFNTVEFVGSNRLIDFDKRNDPPINTWTICTIDL